MDGAERRGSPRPFSLRGVRLLTKRTVVESYEDRILGLAAEAGFWALVALPPLLLAVVGVAGYVVSSLGFTTVDHIRSEILSNAGTLLSPSAVDTVVRPVVDQVLASGRADLVSIGFVISLWAGSTAMSAYVNTITIAYDMRNLRGPVRSRILAFFLYLGAVVVGVVLLPLLVAGPQIGDALASATSFDQAATAVHVAYWPAAALISVALIASLYHLSVPVRTPWRRDLPGALLAMLIWLVTSEALRFYFTEALGNTTTYYGTIAAPIAVLLWLYFTALAVLIGAEVNAEIDKLWPLSSTENARARSQRLAEHRGKAGAAGGEEPPDEDGNVVPMDPKRRAAR